MDKLYPLTIIKDRYLGSYSDSTWLAFNLYENELPDEVSGGDSECLNFWWEWNNTAINSRIPIGRGRYPAAAYEDLMKQFMALEVKISQDNKKCSHAHVGLDNKCCYCGELV